MASAKSYYKKAYELQNEAADATLKKYTQQITYAKKQAGQTFNAAKTSTLQDYYKYINPYGVQSEALGHSGLSNSGLSQTSLSGAWSNYQNTLGQARTAYQNALSQANLSLAGYKADTTATKKQNKANYYDMLASLRSSGGGSGSQSTQPSILANNINTGAGAGIKPIVSSSAGAGKKTTKNSAQKSNPYYGTLWYLGGNFTI